MDIDMRRVLCGYNSGEYCQGYHNISCDLQMPIPYLRKLTKLLKREGWLLYGHLTNEDTGMLSGWGYYWSTAGSQLAIYAENDADTWLK